MIRFSDVRVQTVALPFLLLAIALLAVSNLHAGPPAIWKQRMEGALGNGVYAEGLALLADGTVDVVSTAEYAGIDRFAAGSLAHLSHIELDPGFGETYAPLGELPQPDGSRILTAPGDVADAAVLRLNADGSVAARSRFPMTNARSLQAANGDLIVVGYANYPGGILMVRLEPRQFHVRWSRMISTTLFRDQDSRPITVLAGSDDRYFVLVRGDGSNFPHGLLAVGGADGTALWAQSADIDYSTQIAVSPDGSLFASLYSVGLGGVRVVRRLDGATGATLWENIVQPGAGRAAQSNVQPSGTYVPPDHLAASATAVYAMQSDGSGNNFVVRMAAADGSLAWTTPVPDFDSIVAATNDDVLLVGTYFFGGHDLAKLRRISAADGATAWEWRTAETSDEESSIAQLQEASGSDYVALKGKSTHLPDGNGFVRLLRIAAGSGAESFRSDPIERSRRFRGIALDDGGSRVLQVGATEGFPTAEFRARALATSDGHELWSQQVSPHRSIGDSNNYLNGVAFITDAEPTADGGLVFVGRYDSSRSYVLASLSRDSGALRWQQTANGQNGTGFTISHSPTDLASDSTGNIFFAEHFATTLFPATVADWVAKLDRSSGQTLWTRDLSASVIRAIYARGDDVITLGSSATSGGLLNLSGATGATIWSHSLASALWTYAQVEVLAGGDVLVAVPVGGSSGSFPALAIERLDGLTGVAKWSVTHADSEALKMNGFALAVDPAGRAVLGASARSATVNGHGAIMAFGLDLADGHPLWSNRRMVNIAAAAVSAPALVSNSVFHLRRRDSLYERGTIESLEFASDTGDYLGTRMLGGCHLSVPFPVNDCNIYTAAVLPDQSWLMNKIDNQPTSGFSLATSRTPIAGTSHRGHIDIVFDHADAGPTPPQNPWSFSATITYTGPPSDGPFIAHLGDYYQLSEWTCSATPPSTCAVSSGGGAMVQPLLLSPGASVTLHATYALGSAQEIITAPLSIDPPFDVLLDDIDASTAKYSTALFRDDFEY